MWILIFELKYKPWYEVLAFVHADSLLVVPEEFARVAEDENVVKVLLQIGHLELFG